LIKGKGISAKSAPTPVTFALGQPFSRKNRAKMARFCYHPPTVVVPKIEQRVSKVPWLDRHLQQAAFGARNANPEVEFQDSKYLFTRCHLDYEFDFIRQEGYNR